MKPFPDAEWVRMGPDLGFSCQRCGDRQPMASPIDIDVMIAAANAYVRKHEKCRPKEEVKP